MKRKLGQWANFLLTLEWIKPEDSENLTKIQKHDERTSLRKILKYYWKLLYMFFQQIIAVVYFKFINVVSNVIFENFIKFLLFFHSVFQKLADSVKPILHVYSSQF